MWTCQVVVESFEQGGRLDFVPRAQVSQPVGEALQRMQSRLLCWRVFAVPGVFFRGPALDPARRDAHRLTKLVRGRSVKITVRELDALEWAFEVSRLPV